MDLYREGFLNKAGKGVIQTRLHTWRPRYFVLDGPDLKYYKVKDIKPDNLLGTIHLAEIESVGPLMKSEKKCFQITTKPPKSRTYYMSGRSEDEVMEWVKVIEMGKARQLAKTSENETTRKNTLSMYDEVRPPSQSLMGAPKPRHGSVKPIPSDYFLIGPASFSADSPISSSSSNSDKPIQSEYECVRDIAHDNRNSDEQLPSDKSPLYEETGFSDEEYIDSTYEKVLPKSPDIPKRSSVKKTGSLDSKSEVEVGLYDTINNVSRKGNDDPTAVQTAPPVPSRDPSISLDMDEVIPGGHEVNYDDPFDGQDPIWSTGIYGDVTLPNDEVPEGEEGNKEDSGKLEAKKPLYAKPMRKYSSKRHIPGMVDIGEVSDGIEVDSAGGKETLRRGMTAPIGERFAVVELRDMLDKYAEDTNEHDISDQTKVVHFDFNDGESAFDVLKRFLDKY